MTTPQPQIQVTCHSRTTSLPTPVEDRITALRSLAGRGILDELSFRTWPSEVSLSTPAGAGSVVERFERFLDWAEHHGVSIQPPFAVRDRTTLIHDSTETILVCPVVCLAISLDGRLASVVPHRTGTTNYSVDDALADLRGDTTSRLPSGIDPTEQPVADREVPPGDSDGQPTVSLSRNRMGPRAPQD